MITSYQVLDALKHVQDPELHKSIVELKMVRHKSGIRRLVLSVYGRLKM